MIMCTESEWRSNENMEQNTQSGTGLKKANYSVDKLQYQKRGLIANK